MIPVRRPLILAVGVVALIATACTDHRPAVGPPVTRAAANQTTLLTIGGSATEGDGTDDRLRDAWPYVVFRDALPPSSVLVNACHISSETALWRAGLLNVIQPMPLSLVAMSLSVVVCMSGIVRLNKTRILKDTDRTRSRPAGRMKLKVCDSKSYFAVLSNS